MLKAGLTVTDEELAIICASHSGSQIHIDLVTKMLEKSSIPLTALKNAIDKPLGDKEKQSWGDKPGTRITQNCSGKHAGMLITCKQNNWDIDTYLEMDHPLQILIKNEIEMLAGENISISTLDGCGAPLYAISLTGLARAISNLVKSNKVFHKRIVAACTKYPELVAGEGRLTTRIMRSVPGSFVKEGAEGVEVCTLADGRIIAIKIIDGSWRPVEPILKEVFKLWSIAFLEESAQIYGGSNMVGSIVANL
jgi:L-asparaginase II